ncbi:hypothetical protein T4B_14522, partial [Trichinella pseudospiralis]
MFNYPTHLRHICSSGNENSCHFYSYALMIRYSVKQFPEICIAYHRTPTDLHVKVELLCKKSKQSSLRCVHGCAFACNHAKVDGLSSYFSDRKDIAIQFICMKHSALYCLFVDLCDIASQSIVNNILRFSNLATVMDCFEAMHEIAAYSTKFSLKSRNNLNCHLSCALPNQ